MSVAKIMIVEDEAIVAEDLRETLHNLGYSVIAVVSSGEEAVKSAQKHYPDLILMDIVLSGDMSGIDAANVIKYKTDIPIIYLTSYSDEHIVKKAKQTEPYGYILKPFEQRKLDITIELALYKTKMERRLKESEEKFNKVFSSSDIGLIITDAEGYIDDCNKVALDLLGVESKESFESLSLFKAPRIPPSILEAINEKFSVRFDQKVDFKMVNEVYFKTKKMSISHFDVFITPFKHYNEGYLIQLNDITQIKRTEEGLVESEEKFRIISEKCPLGIMVFQEENCLYVNPALLEMFDYTFDEFISLSIEDHFANVHPEDRDFVKTQFWKQNKGEKEGICENYPFRWYSKEQMLKYLEIYSSTIEYENKPAILAVVIDVTTKHPSKED